MDFTWPLINDNISQTDRQVMADFCLHGKRFTNGEKVREFEAVWSKWLGVPHTVMVNSGASANFIAIAMVKELCGAGEIIVPPLGWVSDISSVTQLGMTPVFVDIAKENLAITSQNIERAITPNTKAIVLVHCLGFNGINREIIRIAKEKNLILIEDCCESHGATFDGQKVGSFGDISVFSFYFGHHITTIEGGVVCTKTEAMNDLARLFRSHGMTREASRGLQEKYQAENPNLNPLFTFAVAGFNMRSTELNAVLGLEQMKRLDFNVKRRSENYMLWVSSLNPDKFFTGFDSVGNSNFALPLVLKTADKAQFSKVCEVLNSEKVEFRVGTAGGGNQALQPYLKKFDFRIIGDLEVANYIHTNALYIGNHTDLTAEMITGLCDKLNKC